MKKFNNFRMLNGIYTVQNHYETTDNLPVGAYSLVYDGQNDVLYYNSIDINHDEILDLPSTEFDHVLSEMQFFLSNEAKNKFAQYGFIYKRSSLLYGLPGTGKTVLINRIIREVLKSNGIVLFNPKPSLLTKAYEQLEDLQPDVLTLVVFEELDELLQYHEKDLLNLLDGEIQKKNIIYMATTNFINKIPERIKRPGRFSTVLEVHYPDVAARTFYLKNKLGLEYNVSKWVEKTEGFSIDELKETVVSTMCLNQDLDKVIKRIKDGKKTSNFHKNSEIDEDNSPWGDSDNFLIDPVLSLEKLASTKK